MESSVTACCVWRSDWLLGGPTEGLFFSFQRELQQSRPAVTWPVPHALRGLVLVVALELRRAQHGLGEDRQEAQGFHEHGGVQEEVGDVGRHQREGQHALHVVQEVAPQPEVVPVEVYRWWREFLYFSSVFKKNTFHSEVNFLCSSFLTEKEHNPNSNHWSACFLTLQHELLHLFQLKHRFLLREATYNRRTRETARLTAVYGENLITAQTHSCAAAVEG